MRKTFAITIFYLYLTAAANLLEIIGLTEAWGVGTPVGVTTQADKVVKEAKTIDVGVSILESLISVFSAAASTLEGIARAVFALPLFLESMGIPDPFVAFFMAPAAVIVGRDILHALSGRFA